MLFDSLLGFFVTIPRYYIRMSISTVLSLTARFWNFLLLGCFPLTYYLNDFMRELIGTLIFVLLLISFPTCFSYLSSSFSQPYLMWILIDKYPNSFILLDLS